MKYVFSFCWFFLLCIILVNVFPSCTSYLTVNGGQQVPKTVTIFVTGFDTATGHLTLKDVSQHSADPFPAYPGQKIRWKISGVKHFLINNIVEKTAKAPADEVFEKKPHPVLFFSKSWTGKLKGSTGLQGIAVVSDSGGHFINFDYKIVWHKAGGHHTFDPRIQIKMP
jgi:hypothetical protein